MPTLDWLDREHAFRIAARVPTRVLMLPRLQLLREFLRENGSIWHA